MNWTAEIPVVLAGAGSASAWRDAQDRFVSDFVTVGAIMLVIAAVGFIVVRAVWKSGQ